MVTQTADMIHAMSILEPAIQQLYQYDWSSGHKRDFEGGLAILSMGIWFGWKGAKNFGIVSYQKIR